MNQRDVKSDPSLEGLEEIDAGSEDGKRAPRSRRAEPLLLECAWEVCNQVGGIYTVLRSKVPSMMNRWGNRYCLIGPYSHQSAQVEFEPAPLVGAVGQAVKQMRELGFGAHYGRWLVTGRPHVVLLNYLDAFRYLHEVKYRLWTDHHISTPGDDEMVNNVVAFGESVRLFLQLLAQKESPRRKIVTHFHEWMAGAAVPMLRKDAWPGSIIFTTHATLLGRYLAMNHPVFYDHLPFFDAEGEAAHYNIVAQHRIERAAAHGSHVFTTVSDVTAEECKHLLGRPVDLLLPNGLNIQRFAALHEFQNLHREYKERIHEFTVGHFFPSYHFDLDNTLYFFTSGRYEYRNKGMDLTIEALARLNHRLREAGSPVTVVFFVITRAPTRSINVTALQSRAMLREFRNASEAIKEDIGEKLFQAATAGQIPDLNTLIDDYWRLRLRRTMYAWKRDLPPLIVTHDLLDDAKDPVLNQLRNCQLWNNEHDPVKVIYHPDFITATNPLFGIDYDQFVRGCHLGVFPSYYEPWGYTPLESIALGVPAITSDLAGFGSYLKQLRPDHEEKGISIIHRRYSDFHQAADELADRMFRYCQLSRRERINLRNSAESFSEHFDWHNLGKRYHEAHELALDRLV
ncbi:glycosyltransferase [Phycisphaerales bacterium AB-hyl4]|uniref:Glycosyltransferase n=1 Tax=Natronomicrosphaera hydrolytica TaxID=3242702 RepID=A0ABV4U4C6_9BACT